MSLYHVSGELSILRDTRTILIYSTVPPLFILSMGSLGAQVLSAWVNLYLYFSRNCGDVVVLDHATCCRITLPILTLEHR